MVREGGGSGGGGGGEGDVRRSGRTADRQEQRHEADKQTDVSLTTASKQTQTEEWKGRQAKLKR